MKTIKFEFNGCDIEVEYTEALEKQLLQRNSIIPENIDAELLRIFLIEELTSALSKGSKNI